MEEAVEKLKQADVVVFEVDSVLIKENLIDELAKFVGLKPKSVQSVQKMTRLRATGSMTVEETFVEQMNIIKPNLTQMKEFIRSRLYTITPNLKGLLKYLESKNIPIYIKSYGFEYMVREIAKELHIQTDIYANRLKYYYTGDYAGFEKERRAASSLGISNIVIDLGIRHGRVAIIGNSIDNVLNFPPGYVFVGYGGNILRLSVKKKCQWYVTDFGQILGMLKSVEQSTVHIDRDFLLSRPPPPGPIAGTVRRPKIDVGSTTERVFGRRTDEDKRSLQDFWSRFNDEDAATAKSYELSESSASELNLSKEADSENIGCEAEGSEASGSKNTGCKAKDSEASGSIEMDYKAEDSEAAGSKNIHSKPQDTKAAGSKAADSKSVDTYGATTDRSNAVKLHITSNDRKTGSLFPRNALEEDSMPRQLNVGAPPLYIETLDESRNITTKEIEEQDRIRARYRARNQMAAILSVFIDHIAADTEQTASEAAGEATGSQAVESTGTRRNEEANSEQSVCEATDKVIVSKVTDSEAARGEKVESEVTRCAESKVTGNQAAESKREVTGCAESEVTGNQAAESKREVTGCAESEVTGNQAAEGKSEVTRCAESKVTGNQAAESKREVTGCAESEVTGNQAVESKTACRQAVERRPTRCKSKLASLAGRIRATCIGAARSKAISSETAGGSKAADVEGAVSTLADPEVTAGFRNEAERFVTTIDLQNMRVHYSMSQERSNIDTEESTIQGDRRSITSLSETGIVSRTIVDDNRSIPDSFRRVNEHERSTDRVENRLAASASEQSSNEEANSEQIVCDATDKVIGRRVTYSEAARVEKVESDVTRCAESGVTGSQATASEATCDETSGTKATSGEGANSKIPTSKSGSSNEAEEPIRTPGGLVWFVGLFSDSFTPLKASPDESEILSNRNREIRDTGKSARTTPDESETNQVEAIAADSEAAGYAIGSQPVESNSTKCETAESKVTSDQVAASRATYSEVVRRVSTSREAPRVEAAEGNSAVSTVVKPKPTSKRGNKKMRRKK